MTPGSAKPAAYFIAFRMVFHGFSHGRRFVEQSPDRTSVLQVEVDVGTFFRSALWAGRAEDFFNCFYVFLFLSLGRRLQLGLKSVAAQRPTKHKTSTGEAHSRKRRNLSPTSSRANR